MVWSHQVSLPKHLKEAFYQKLKEDKMIINTTKENIQYALDEANKEFEGNLEFNNLQRLSDNRYRVTLRVKDSHGKGARLGIPQRDWQTGEVTGKARHLISACWHAHGRFFDKLPEGTRIQTGGNTTYAGDKWEDFNIGSKIFPYYISEACECR